MKRFLLTIVVLAAAASSVDAWNEKGHMVVARIAWKELKAEERAKVVQFLGSHPHFGQFLKADRPPNIPEDEWVFMRAATWSDWVRSGPPKAKFHKRNAHFINIPFVPEGSTVKPPPPAKENILQQITDSKLIARTGNQEDRAIHLCWLFHLVGDIHQPLHCTTLFSDDFPIGDRGGNRSLIKVEGRVVQMHSFWDGLLGTSTSRSSLGKAVLEIETLVQNNPAVIAADLANHKTPKEWAEESFQLGKLIAYLDGKLKPADGDDDPQDNLIPHAPQDYAEEAGETARYCVAKAGKRLAEVIREVLAAN